MAKQPLTYSGNHELCKLHLSFAMHYMFHTAPISLRSGRQKIYALLCT
jgi:hypothetical protein